MKGYNPFVLVVLLLYTLGQVYGADTVSYEISNITSVSYGEIRYSATLRSKTECASTCSEDNSCRATMFDPVTMECTTNRWTVDLSGLVCGTETDCSGSTTILYGKKQLRPTMRLACQSGTDCLDPKSECRGNQCLCEPGYSYNHNSYECVASCTAYRDTFQPDVDKVLYLNTQHSLEHLQLEDCLAACAAWTAFLCLTVEWAPHLCILQDFTKLDRPDLYMVYPGYILYTRDCL